jgi:hypothetical protein
LKAKGQSFSKIFYRLKQPIREAFRVLDDIPELFTDLRSTNLLYQKQLAFGF